MSYTFTTTESFTLTNAKKLAAKVTSDMHQCHLFYKRPSREIIPAYEQELIVLLAGGFLDIYEFGFKSNERRVVSWRYRVTLAGDLEGGRSGGLYATADVTRASWFNFLTPTDPWWRLSESQRQIELNKYTIRRTPGSAPGDGDGVWISERVYTSGGVAVKREEFRPR